jgi:hypothetical protein
MRWSEVKTRAAINTAWQWHHPGALDALKDEMVRKDQWRVDGNFADKGPFPQPTTDVKFQELHRDDDTGEVTLKITPVCGDSIYYDTGSEATEGSIRVEDSHTFKTCEMEASFLCVDSAKQHEAGKTQIWKNRITLKKKVYGNNGDKFVELKSAPSGAVIKYSTDGSNPLTNGGVYQGPFAVQKGTRLVLAVAQKNEIISDQLQVPINWNGDSKDHIDLNRPAKWKREHLYATTKESFEFIGRLKKHSGKIPGPRVTIVGNGWVELAVDEKIALNSDQIETLINCLRGIYSEGQVSIDARSLLFPLGQQLVDYATDEKTEFNNNEVDQS